MKKFSATVITIILLLTMFPATKALAAAPKKPAISVQNTEDKMGILITIDKTSGADGYYVYIKTPDSEKFKRVKTITGNGTKARSYTYSINTDGTYSVKVKAYAKTTSGKVSGKYSTTVTVDVKKTKDIDIIDVVNNFPYVKGEYPTRKKPYTIKCSVSEQLKDAILCVEYVDANGNIRPRDVEGNLKLNNEKLSVYSVGPGGADLAIVAYANIDDAGNQSNPIAVSEIFNINVYDPNNTDNEDESTNSPGPEQDKYADIIYENGYVYLGSYPQAKVNDKVIISELNKLQQQNSGSAPKLYKDKYYQLAEIKGVASWYEAKPVEWVILEGSLDSDTITLMASTCLLATGFNDYSGYSSSTGWKGSFLRAHLNGYDTSKYKSIWSYDFLGILFANSVERVLMEQSYGNCTDKVLLATKAQAEALSAKRRTRTASEMAVTAVKYGYWLMDSAGSGKQYVVDTSGKITTTESWRQEYGVVPVIKVDLSKCNIIIK